MEAVGRDELDKTRPIQESSYDVTLIPILDYKEHIDLEITDQEIYVNKHTYNKLSLNRYERAVIDKMKLTKVYEEYRPVNLGLGVNILLASLGLIVLLNIILLWLDTIISIVSLGFCVKVVLKVITSGLVLVSIVKFIIKKLHNKPKPNHYILRYNNEKGKEEEFKLPIGGVDSRRVIGLLLEEVGLNK